MNDTFVFTRLCIFHNRNNTLIIRFFFFLKKRFEIFLRYNISAKNKANPLVYLLQKGNFLLGWLMECLLLKLKEINQMAAGNTHLLPLMLIKNN